MRFCLPLWAAARVLSDASLLARVVTVASGNVNAAKKIEAVTSGQILLLMLRVSLRFDYCSQRRRPLATARWARRSSENGLPLAGSQLLSLSAPGNLAPAYSVSEPS
jgi:hypothetical protein